MAQNSPVLVKPLIFESHYHKHSVCAPRRRLAFQWVTGVSRFPASRNEGQTTSKSSFLLALFYISLQLFCFLFSFLFPHHLLSWLLHIEWPFNPNSSLIHPLFISVSSESPFLLCCYQEVSLGNKCKRTLKVCTHQNKITMWAGLKDDLQGRVGEAGRAGHNFGRYFNHSALIITFFSECSSDKNKHSSQTVSLAFYPCNRENEFNEK